MSTARLRLASLLALSVLGSGIAWGALEFKNPRVELEPPAPGVSSLEAEFPFTNTGDATVTILETHSSCGCTVPEVTEKIYAPGAQGVLKARFDIGGRQGLQTKQITVRTDAGDHALSFSVNLPQRLTITPRLHIFRAGAPTEHAFGIAIRGDAPAKSVEVVSKSPHYTTEVIEKKAGADYEIVLKLTDEAPPVLRETIQVRSIGASGIEYADTFFLRRSP